MSNILNDRIIDDQGNARTVANGQDARLSYIDVFGNRKKYLLEGEGGGGGDVKVPTKTSELQNDSGFITADDIPAGGTTDLSDYTGNVNLKYQSGNSYLTTSDKTFTLGSSPKAYVSQMNSGVIHAGDLLSISTDTFRIMDASASNTIFYIDKLGNVRATSSIDAPKIKVNGVNVAVGQNQATYYDQNLNIQPGNNQFWFPYYNYPTWNEGIYSLELNIYQNVDNFTLLFKTAANFSSYTININVENFLINKPFNFEANKTYIICIYKNILFWSKVEQYIS